MKIGLIAHPEKLTKGEIAALRSKIKTIRKG